MPYSVRINAQGTEPIEYSISAVGLANGLTCNPRTGEIRGTPNLKAQSIQLTLYAENSAGEAKRTVTLNIKRK